MNDCSTYQYGCMTLRSFKTVRPWHNSFNILVLKYHIHAVGVTISNTISDAYTHTVTQTCSASCGNGTKSVDWYLYQWNMSPSQYIAVSSEQFQIIGCEYVCSTSATLPKCPPGYCKPDTNCLECEPWQ